MAVFHHDEGRFIVLGNQLGSRAQTAELGLLSQLHANDTLGIGMVLVADASGRVLLVELQLHWNLESGNALVNGLYIGPVTEVGFGIDEQSGVGDQVDNASVTQTAFRLPEDLLELVQAKQERFQLALPEL